MNNFLRSFLLGAFLISSFHAQAEDAWVQISDADGVKTFQRQVENTSIVAFRGETEVEAPIERVAAVLADVESRKEWIDDLIEAKNLEVKNILDRVDYNYTHVSWPFQDRDLVYSVKVDVDQKKREMKILMKAAEHPAMPPRSGIVRAQMKDSHYFVKDLGNNRTFVSVEIAVDPKGNVPLWLVRMKQKKWPRKTLLAFKKFTAGYKKPIPAEFEAYSKKK
jgi:hypothetical protein